MSKEKTENQEHKTSKNSQNQENNASPNNETTTDNLQDTAEAEAGEDLKTENSDPLEKLQDELADAKDKYLRLYSEFDNYRRRTAKEKLELMQTANEDLFLSLLPALDDFERAVNAFPKQESVDAIKEGMNLIFNKFSNITQQKGLKKMDTSVGAKFDTDLHEAITQIPAPKSKLKGKIVDTVEKGYYLGDKVIRHARVVIGN